jgi:hypothetical protein
MLGRLFLGMIFTTMVALPAFALADNTESHSANTNSLITAGALCDINTLGVSESDVPVTLYAVWKPKTYKCESGQYVHVQEGSVECEICPKDHYCPEFNDDDSSHTYEPGESDYGIYQCDEGYHANFVGATGATDCQRIFSCAEKNPYGAIEHALDTTTYVNEFTVCSQPVDGEETCTLSCEFRELKCESGYKAKYEDGVWTCEVNTVKCEPGTYLPAGEKECVVCPEDSYCAGSGEDSFTFKEVDPEGKDNDQGIFKCDDGLKAPEGSTSYKDCGILMRIDGDALYLRAERVMNGNPAFVTQDSKGNDWYATMTPVSEGKKKVSKGSDKELHVKVGNVEYTVHTVTTVEAEKLEEAAAAGN